MLKTNSFRPDRYLRSKFLEGRYLLATELVDVQLELLDQFRKTLKVSVGNVAIDSAWEVSYYSNTQVLIKPGSAWYEGLPFNLRSSTDEMVSAGYLANGVGYSVLAGQGILLTFSGTTPTDSYRVIISAEENIITDIQDPFIKNANIPESTAQKVKLKYKINVVSAADQGTFAPYKNETLDKNLTNTIQITPTLGGQGELLATNSSSIPENIDGSNLELVFKNTSGSNYIPIASADRAYFVNGILTDTVGQKYYITAIFTDPVFADRTVIRVDKDVDQPNPTITNGQPYYLTKRDVYVTDNTGAGSPVGKVYWPVAEVDWDSANFFAEHSSKITDLRERIITEVDYETTINEKLNLQLTGGGVIDVETDGETLHWSADFTVVNPSSTAFTIPTNTAVVVEGGSLAYTLGTTPLGPLGITVTSVLGNDLTLASIDLSTIRLGNVVKVGSESSYITAIDNSNDIITVSGGTFAPGAGFIYRDSFGPGTVKTTEKTFILATRVDDKIRVGNYLELSAGESNATYDERILYPAGLAANTNITLPDNSKTGRPQYYSYSKRNLEVYVNQLLKYQGADWSQSSPVASNQIKINFDLAPNSEVHFRIDSLPSGSVGGGGSGGGGAGTLQEAYDGGNSISTVTGLPVTISGPSGEKLLHVQGDVQIDGVLDPTGLELTPQASNPLDPGMKGIWANTANQLIFENGTTAENISQRLDDLESGASNPITAGPGLTKTINDLSVNVDDSTIEIVTDTLQIKDLGVTTDKIDDGAVTEDKLASSVAGAGLSGGSGSPLAVNVDGSTLEITGDTLNVKASGITVNELADDSVTEDKLNSSVAGDGLTGGGGTALAVGEGNGLQVNADDVEVVHSPKTKITAIAGESFNADTTYLVRWAVSGETEGAVYKATAQTATNGKYITVGVLLSSVPVVATDTVEILVAGEHTLGASDTPFVGADAGKDLFLKSDGSGGFTLTPSTTVGDAQYKVGTVKATDTIWLGDAYLKAVVPAALYDEEIYYPSGLAASTPITLPNSKTYNQTSHELQVFLNGVMKFQGTDWSASTPTQITFPYALPNDSRVVFRIIPPASGTLTGGGGGGGGGSLQDAYDAGNSITISSGVPVTVNGPGGQSLTVFNGDIEITGVIL